VKSKKLPQQHVHQDLPGVVHKHLVSPWLRPVPAHTAQAFAAVRDAVETSTKPLILDSCCGTGDSTRYLAYRFPDAQVIGIDKSAHRLQRYRDSNTHNCMVLQADVNDFWRLAVEYGWQPIRHYLLYPNPYPKASQLRKRWYGSPAFPSLLALGGVLTVRSNWPIYVEEFALALKIAGYAASRQTLVDAAGITAFETKYAERGHRLLEMVCDLQQPLP
jgi:tRNA (guanine-N7-)-methyltransferase